MSKPFRSPSLFAMSLLVLPFLVGFDIPDSAGTYVKGSGGRGAYHLSSCSNSYDFEYTDAQLAVRKTFATKPVREKPGSRWWIPDFTTLGLSADMVRDHLLLAREDSTDVTARFPGHSLGWVGNLYLGVDWKWVGLDLGLSGIDLRSDYPDVDTRVVAPAGGLRLGPEWLYVSGEAFGGGSPFMSGGYVRTGAGGRWRNTRAWAGMIAGPPSQVLPTLVLSQGLADFRIMASVSWNGRNVPPSGLGIDNEYAASLGLEYRIPGL